MLGRRKVAREDDPKKLTRRVTVQAAVEQFEGTLLDDREAAKGARKAEREYRRATDKVATAIIRAFKPANGSQVGEYTAYNKFLEYGYFECTTGSKKTRIGLDATPRADTETRRKFMKAVPDIVAELRSRATASASLHGDIEAANEIVRGLVS